MISVNIKIPFVFSSVSILIVLYSDCVFVILGGGFFLDKKTNVVRREIYCDNWVFKINSIESWKKDFYLEIAETMFDFKKFAKSNPSIVERTFIYQMWRIDNDF